MTLDPVILTAASSRAGASTPLSHDERVMAAACEFEAFGTPKEVERLDMFVKSFIAMGEGNGETQTSAAWLFDGLDFARAFDGQALSDLLKAFPQVRTYLGKANELRG